MCHGTSHAVTAELGLCEWHLGASFHKDGVLEKLGEGGLRGKLLKKKWQWRLQPSARVLSFCCTPLYIHQVFQRG